MHGHHYPRTLLTMCLRAQRLAIRPVVSPRCNSNPALQLVTVAVVIDVSRSVGLRLSAQLNRILGR